MGQGARTSDGRGLRPAQLRAGRGLPIRLEPRGRPAERRDGDREGRPCPALSQPHDVRPGLPARDAWYLIERACFSLISALSRSPTMRCGSCWRLTAVAMISSKASFMLI